MYRIIFSGLTKENLIKNQDHYLRFIPPVLTMPLASLLCERGFRTSNGQLCYRRACEEAEVYDFHISIWEDRDVHSFSLTSVDNYLFNQARCFSFPWGSITLCKNPRLSFVGVINDVDDEYEPSFVYSCNGSCSKNERSNGLYPHQTHSSNYVVSSIRRSSEVNTNFPMVFVDNAHVGYVMKRDTKLMFLKRQSMMWNWHFLCDEMGLGKTKTSYDVIRQCEGKVLVLTKAILCPQWLTEAPNEDDLHRITIISFDKFSRRVKGILEGERYKLSPQRRRQKTITFNPFEHKYSFIFVDEGHILLEQDFGSQFKFYFQRFVREMCDFPQVVFVTGTPPFSFNLKTLSNRLPDTRGSMLSFLLKTEMPLRSIRHVRQQISGIPLLKEKVFSIRLQHDVRDLIIESQNNVTDSLSRLLNTQFRICLESGFRCIPWWNERFTSVRGFHPEDGCTICCSDKVDPVILTNCNHEFCYDCMMQWISRSPNCPICRTVAPATTIRKIVDDSVIQADNFVQVRSERVEWLIQKASKRTSRQIVVFVELSKIIPYIVQCLHDVGISSEELTGTTSPGKKQTVCNDFVDKKFQVLVTTMRVSSVGINLQNAALVVFWTNLCSSENAIRQATGRLLRLGSEHTHITKYILTSSYL